MGAADVEAGEDLDYFDLEDLGRLRRRVRRAIENTQRERELYLDIVLQYFEVLLIQMLILYTTLHYISGLTKCDRPNSKLSGFDLNNQIL